MFCPKLDFWPRTYLNTRTIRAVFRFVFVEISILFMLDLTILSDNYAISQPISHINIDKKINSINFRLEAQPSTSSTIIRVQTRSSTYYVPRNYILYPDREYPILRVTWPGFKPLTEETRSCFEHRQLNCIPIDLMIRGGDGPAPGGRAYTNREMLANLLKGLDPKIKKGPYGFKVYIIGPQLAQHHVYVKDTGLDIINPDCFFMGNTSNSICSVNVFLSDGNAIYFLYHEDRIGDIESIENQIRALFGRFSERKSRK